jgi:hypothetical protein
VSTKPTEPAPKRVQREAVLEWVPIDGMRVSPLAQRDLNQARVDRLAADFDLEQLGTPTVNHRDGHWYVIDGQHRVNALIQIGYGDQQIQCWAYQGLSDVEEADKFLKLNDILTVNAFAKFKVSILAGREEECDIDQTVRSCGLRVSQDKKDGSVSAVNTLRRVYRRGGRESLSRALCIIRDAYGDPGLEAPIIDGIGLLCQRYNGNLSDERATTALSKAFGGVNALLGKAEFLRKQTGNPKAHCVAAAAVELINSGRGGKKLPSWWKTDPASEAA